MKRVSQQAAHYIRDELLKRERFIVIALDTKQEILSVNRSNPEWKLPGLIRGSALPDALASLLSAAGGVNPTKVRRAQRQSEGTPVAPAMRKNFSSQLLQSAQISS